MRALIKKLPVIRQFLGLKNQILTLQQQILTQQQQTLSQQQQWTESLMWNQSAIMQGLMKNMESARVLQDHSNAIQATMEGGFATIEDHFARARSHVRTAQYGLTNPEAGLMAHLYASLPNRYALDVGSNVGEIAERLLDAGYQVYAFEPFPPVFAQLQRRIGQHKNVRVYNLAIGLNDCEMDLHVASDTSGTDRYKDFTQFSSLVCHSMPEDLPFVGKVRVQVRTLESLRKSKEIPSDIGLLKIDTEGYDLEVLRGMGKMRPDVIVTEFWDREMPFGKFGTFNRLEDLVRELRDREYHWHVVLYRIDGSPDISFYCNQPESVSKSWGNVFFFRDYQIFTEALQWCSAVLPRTYFQN